VAVRTEISARVLTVILDRPERRNAVDAAVAAQLAEVFRAFDADETLDVAVLWGSGGCFCAGADLKAVAEDAGAANTVVEQGDGPMGPTRMQLGKPVIAAISGHAVAGGLELALWCDLRVVEESAVMGVFCRRWGVPLIDGGTVRLPRLIGLSRALDLILTGRAVDAREALQIGLATRVVPDGHARRAAEALAAELSRFPQACMRHDRLSALEQADFGFGEAMRNEFRHGMHVITTAGIREGAGLFASGRGRHGGFDDFEASEPKG